jgi:hypothetical protein
VELWNRELREGGEVDDGIQLGGEHERDRDDGDGRTSMPVTEWIRNFHQVDCTY